MSTGSERQTARQQAGTAKDSGFGQGRSGRERLRRYLAGGVSPAHVVKGCVEDLKAAGFEELNMTKPWALREHGKYYVVQHGTTLLAFVLPAKEQMIAGDDAPSLRIACAHTDFPCLRVKPGADLYTREYHKLNCEVYGGAILNTWLDRPLGIAGRVMLASEETFAPREMLYDSGRGVLTVPNLAIHMNPEVNKGQELNRQVDLMPLFAMKEEERSFADFLAQELGAENILDHDLTVYVAEEPAELGRDGEFLSAPRIDNISSVAAIMEALCEGHEGEGAETASDSLLVAAFFDHEEIGSRSKQGALSALLADVVEKIYESAGLTRRQAKDAVYQGMMLSVDVAHGLHPNHPEKADVSSQPLLTQGFCIKEAASQSYATDCGAVSILEQLARGAGIPYQKYVNRSDVRGGSTLGALSGALLPMKVVDIGIPILAMHSAREVMGIRDMDALCSVVRAFFAAQ